MIETFLYVPARNIYFLNHKLEFYMGQELLWIIFLKADMAQEQFKFI